MLLVCQYTDFFHVLKSKPMQVAWMNTSDVEIKESFKMYCIVSQFENTV